MSPKIQRYVIPGLVFQSVIIGGGYGTGREISEFFLSHGAVGGLLGMAVTALVWSVVLAIAFEFSRISKAYDYRAFFKALLGPVWPVFEIVYLLIVLLVLSVLGSAAGEMLSQAWGLPSAFGALALLMVVGFLAYLGGKSIERVLAGWSVLLYGVYAVFLVWTLTRFGGTIRENLVIGDVIGAWPLDGVRYAAYNLIALGAVLFVLPRLETRTQALTSGGLAGALGILPGVFVYLAMLSRYPGIEADAVPVLSVLQGLNSVWFYAIFQIVLFGTFIETGVGLIHAINERVAGVFIEKDKTFPNLARAIIALGFLTTAIFLASAVGIIDLIAKGYGVLSYAFIVIVILPLMSIGLYKILTFSDPIQEPVREVH